MASRIHSHLLRLNPQARRRKTFVSFSTVAGGFVILGVAALFWLGRYHAH
jgi:hypothetical protein